MAQRINSVTSLPSSLSCLFLAVMMVTAGCAGAGSAPAENVDLCLRGLRGCVPERLDPRERGRIERRAAAEHLVDCLNRLRCNASLLSEGDRARVRASVKKLNFEACLRQEVDCDERLLDDAQHALVARAFRRRNLDHCLAACRT